ncbi:MAG: hydrogen gas-evolving membrane-bound hydrogenase subunit E, partial [Pseudomonadota bacterium]
VVANALMVALALVVIFRVVFGRQPAALSEVREAPPALWIGPILLAIAGLLFGLMPDLLAQYLVQPAVIAIVGEPQVVKLKLWHGVNVPLMMSIATVAMGALGFFLHRQLCGALGKIPEVAVALWDRMLEGILTGFGAITRFLQPGSLRTYLSVTFLAIFCVPLIGLAISGPVTLPVFDWNLAALGAVALSCVGAIVTAIARRRMLALGGLSATGVGIALLFVIFGAPDVAITQLLVDVLLVVLIAALLVRLPEFRPRRDGRLRDAVLAGVAGISVAALTFIVTSGTFDTSLAESMSSMSVPEAKGRNVVNVILVDFRALDTFGEIVVVAAAAIGALALIRISARPNSRSLSQ